MRGQSPAEGAHDWMVMGPDGHLFQRYISDLAGIDPSRHNGTPEQVCKAVLAWLVTRPDAQVAVGPAEVVAKLRAYSERKQALDEEWSTNAPPWGEVLDTAIEIVGG